MKAKRGFAVMDKDKRSKIASLGGKAAHAKGRAHEFTSEEARAAGIKGGSSPKRRVRPKLENPVKNLAEHLKAMVIV